MRGALLAALLGRSRGAPVITPVELMGWCDTHPAEMLPVACAFVAVHSAFTEVGFASKTTVGETLTIAC